MEGIATPSAEPLENSINSLKRKYDEIFEKVISESNNTFLSPTTESEKLKKSTSLEFAELTFYNTLNMIACLQDPHSRSNLEKYYIENSKEIFSILQKSVDNITYSDLCKLIQESELYPLLKELFERSTSFITGVKFYVDKVDKNIDLNGQNAVIEMNTQELVMVFIGKVEHDKEDVDEFLEKFLDLQNVYKSEAAMIQASQIEWIERFTKLNDRHGEMRVLSKTELERELKGVEIRFKKVFQLHKDKYLGLVFNLHDTILLKPKKRGNLSKESTSVLRNWLFQHFLHPYPTEDEKKDLGKATGLSITQVNNWFINARVRTWKPMLENMLESEKDKKKVPSRPIQSTQQVMEQRQRNMSVPQTTTWAPPVNTVPVVPFTPIQSQMASFSSLMDKNQQQQLQHVHAPTPQRGQVNLPQLNNQPTHSYSSQNLYPPIFQSYSGFLPPWISNEHSRLDLEDESRQDRNDKQ